MARDDYQKIEQAVHGQALGPCPVCGSETAMWQYIDKNGVATKVVCCSRGDPIVEDDPMCGGCALYLPPNVFYMATYREAATYHARFTRAVQQLRDKPIPVVINCPECGLQHVDAPAPCSLHECTHSGVCYASANGQAEKCDRWDNPPHRVHKCAGCGCLFEVASVNTVGVGSLVLRVEKL